MRLSHFSDHHFHINQFDLARNVMTMAITLFGAQTMQDVFRHWKDDRATVFLVIFAFGLCAALYSSDFIRLRRASEAYERRPHRVSREAAHYFLMPFFLRLMLLLLGGLVAGILTVVDLTTRRVVPATFIENFWLMLAGCSWYIAGGLPPRRDRKRKKERAPAGAAAQGV
jgi:hypothetical protein